MNKILAQLRLAIRQRRIDSAIATADRVNIDRRKKPRRAPGRDETFRRDQVRPE